MERFHRLVKLFRINCHWWNLYLSHFNLYKSIHLDWFQNMCTSCVSCGGVWTCMSPERQTKWKLFKDQMQDLKYHYAGEVVAHWNWNESHFSYMLNKKTLSCWDFFNIVLFIHEKLFWQAWMIFMKSGKRKYDLIEYFCLSESEQDLQLYNIIWLTLMNFILYLSTKE